jgi:hypothetical protein
MSDSRLTLVRRIGGTRPARAVFRCECGTEREFWYDAVKRGKSRSCGCLNIELAKQRRLDNIKAFTGARLRHGHTEKPTWKTWSSMINRCTNPNARRWSDYGGRGISVCDRWHVYENFFADMGERPKGLSLDRIDNDGNYEPGNCKWSTPKEQAANRRKRGPDTKPRKRRAKNPIAA